MSSMKDICTTNKYIEEMIATKDIDNLLTVIAENYKTGIMRTYNLSPVSVSNIATLLADRYYKIENDVEVNRLYYDNIPTPTVPKYDELLVTTDYKVFKKLEGNRGLIGSRLDMLKNMDNIFEIKKEAELTNYLEHFVAEYNNIDKSSVSHKFLPRCPRVMQLVISYLMVGVLTQPILVNEKYEIIDGQGRFEALKILGFPIKYVMQNGIGLNECIMMNTRSKDWDAIDYVYSFAEKGNQNYILLVNLIQNYPELNLNSIGYAVFGSEIRNTDVMDNKLSLSIEDVVNAKRNLDFANEMTLYMKTMCKDIKGEKDRLHCAMAVLPNFCNIDDEDLGYKCTIDKQRLKDKIKQYLPTDKFNRSWSDVKGAINVISDVYDFNAINQPVIGIKNYYGMYETDRINSQKTGKSKGTSGRGLNYLND